MNAHAISNSYMVTNRAYPWEQWAYYIYPASAGDNSYFMASGANNSNSQQYQLMGSNGTGSMPPDFQSALATDIGNAVANGGAQVTLYIHGLSYYLSDACYTLGTFGQNLAAQNYNGLLIGFSWPSYGSAESTEYYGSLPYSFPPASTRGTIRDNINGSTQSLLNLLSQLVPLCQQYRARLNLVTHSEGNYMLMLAMSALASNPRAYPALTARPLPFVDQILMVAADINNGALQSPQSLPPDAGQGAPITDYANAVTVYWSTNDTLLPFSEEWLDYHNPSFPNRLGLYGPNSNVLGTILQNVTGLDCSNVANEANPYIPWDISVHESYFYIPQILGDMQQTLGNVPPASVKNRNPTGNQSFQMALVPAPLETPHQPSGRSLPKKVPGGA